MKGIFSFLLASLGLIFFLLIVLYIGLIISLTKFFPEPHYDKWDLIENYERRKVEILEVKKYLESILLEEVNVHLEFGHQEELTIFKIHTKAANENYRDLKINSSITDSLLKELDWTKAELISLKSKLEDANCISIANGNSSASIGWQRSGMGIYSYLVFDENLTAQSKKDYSDSCTFIFYKHNIVLEYGGGAFGSDCFPNKQ